MKPISIFAAVFAIGLVAGQHASNALPTAPMATDEVIALVVAPDEIWIDSEFDHPRVVVQARFASGLTRDVSLAATVDVQPPGLAYLDSEARLVPRENGEGRLVASFGGVEVKVALRVRNCDERPRPDFRRDVVPVLTRHGCNAGGCHGSAAGKNGFRLSLFGFDPQEDHARLTRELRGRRLDVGSPRESLVLAKPTMAVPHRGGQVLAADGVDHDTLLRWIEDGAEAENPQRAARLKRLDFGPSEMVAIGAGARQRLVARAIYDDGSDDEVTALCLLSSSDSAVVTVDGEGLLQSVGVGEARVMARFGIFAEVVQVIVLDPEAKAPTWAAEPENLVDRHLFARQARLRVVRSEPADDFVFLRRLYLDLINRPPTLGEQQAFFADGAPGRRDRLIEALLDSDEVADTLALDWADVTGVTEDVNRVSPKEARAFGLWLRDAFRGRRPVDQIFRDILVAQGPTFDEPESTFYSAHR
ncbi:MAG: DUF1549 domain-containing protein, partial [Planctomycetes bacterium]|nr:DUF1549 domain-containing protein [Planctomycetota bacterium]